MTGTSRRISVAVQRTDQCGRRLGTTGRSARNEVVSDRQRRSHIRLRKTHGTSAPSENTMIRRKSSHRHYPNPKGPPTPHFVAPRVNELTLGKPERHRSGFGARQHTVERTPVLDPSGREVGDIQRRFTKNRAIDTATSHYATRAGVQGANLAWLGRQETAHQSGDWERTTGANVEETSHHVVADFNELDDSHRPRSRRTRRDACGRRWCSHEALLPTWRSVPVRRGHRVAQGRVLARAGAWSTHRRR